MKTNCEEEKTRIIPASGKRKDVAYMQIFWSRHPLDPPQCRKLNKK